MCSSAWFVASVERVVALFCLLFLTGNRFLSWFVAFSDGRCFFSEPSSAVGVDDRVGEQFRVRLQQGQSESAVRSVRLRVQDPAQVPHDPRGVHSP